VITHPAFEVEPWGLCERELDLEVLAQSESVLALSNGHVGLRANLDEGEPHAVAGTYLNGFFEFRDLPAAEAAYGLPEAGQAVVNVTDGKIVRLLVDDEPFDVRYGRLLSHWRRLDFRAGVLERQTEWASPTGRAVRISSTRLVSLTQRALAAIRYEIEPIDGEVVAVLQSELVANEPPASQVGDPRAAAALVSPLEPLQHAMSGCRVVLLHRTRRSGLRLAAGMDHVIEGARAHDVEVESEPDLGRVTAAARLRPGQKLRLIKFVAYGWSSQRSVPALRDQVEGALAAARQTGWARLLAVQRAYLDEFWSRADVEIRGDPQLQQAVRFALFHVLQAGARAEQRGIPAKGLTGPGYDGHTFWDSETFVLPVLSYTTPEAAGDALRWRQATLPMARDRARQLGLAGAAFPWRTIRGEECSGYWPAGTAAFHVNADIADAVVRYQQAAADRDFERETGVELLVETARLWRSLGHLDPRDGFRIDGVTGPDEYSAVADNNVYTNLMAQRNLLAAAEAAEVHPDRARDLGVSEQEVAAWREAAERMLVPYDPELGVHPQSEGFTRHQLWDFEASQGRYPLLLHFPYFDLYRKQVVKQADLVLALHLCGDAFTPEEKARDFAYYEAITVRDSSLSACTQAVVAAEVGHLQLATAYLYEAALMDLADLEHNVRDGLHIASLAGTWLAVVAGLGGMRDQGRLTFAPRLPPGLDGFAFRLRYRGRCLLVEVEPKRAGYRLLQGAPIEVHHHGRAVAVSEEPTWLPIPDAPPRPAPSQPPGREPVWPIRG
jgi:alpha,alpha-trehalose phosphorylase